MGFLKKLFGSSNKVTLQDADLGIFKELSHNQDRFIWGGSIKIFDETISLFIAGDSNYLNSQEKIMLFDILKNEVTVEQEINEALRAEYEEADKQYLNWRSHFNCITMSTMGDQISITFEEKKSLHQFNVFLVNGKSTGVSIDS